MKKYIITIITLFLIIVIAIVGYFVYGNIKESKANSSDMLTEKVISEIEYLGNNIIYVMNELNNISYTNYKIVSEEIEDSSSDENSSSSGSNSGQGGSESSGGQSSSEQGDSDKKSTITTTNMSNANSILNDDSTDKINWNNVNMKVQDMYSAWTTIMIDLSSLNVNKDDLLKFNSTLDKISSSLEQKDKENALLNCSDLYSLLSKYVNDFSEENSKIYNVRSNILYSYSEIERENWEEAVNYIKKADENFASILNNQINNIDKIDIINKAYVLLNELQEDCNSKDRKVFLINYSNLMQELQNI